MNFFIICICVAISALYEMTEWWAGAVGGQAATNFIGSQGDPWDTQEDMFMALIGSVAAVAMLPRLHDQQLKNLSVFPAA